MTKTKVSVIVPIKDNEGLALDSEIESIRQEILVLTGGYTESPCSGAWRSDGKTYRDVSVAISVVTSAEIADVIVQRLAPIWARRLRQECLFVERTQVDVAFVPPQPKENL
jgi:hypothetical protein